MGKYSDDSNPSTSTDGRFSATNPPENKSGTMGAGGEDGAGETCMNYPNPYGYNPDKGGPSYDKTRGRRG